MAHSELTLGFAVVAVAEHYLSNFSSIILKADSSVSQSPADTFSKSGHWVKWPLRELLLGRVPFDALKFPSRWLTSSDRPIWLQFPKNLFSHRIPL
jgi:hypothetical protein